MSSDAVTYLGVVEALVQGRRGESNTPFALKICNGEVTRPYVVVGAGIDEVRLAISLSGDSARFAEHFTEHDYRPRGIPSMRFVGAWRQDGFSRTFDHFCGNEEKAPKLMYHRKSAMLHVSLHFDSLKSPGEALEASRALVDKLAKQGLPSLFPARLARLDVAGDVVFRSADLYQYVHSAFASMLAGSGRVVDPYKTTLYLHASKADRAKRLGRVYDKGVERAKHAGWAIPSKRYMRIEAEKVIDHPRPELDHLNAEQAQRVFLDRWESVGRGTLLLKGGLVEPLMALLHDGTISEGQYERLYTFLDHCRMGLAEELYAAKRDTYLRRCREVRELGLEVPGEDGRPIEDLQAELDVRKLVRELAASV